MDKVSFYLTVIFFIIILSPLSKAAKNLYNFTDSCSKLSKKTMILNDELNKLSLREFTIWCCGFLKGNDFENIGVVANDIGSGTYIKCSKNERIYYAECFGSGESLENNKEVDVDDLKNLLGAMVGDNIKDAIIITTGKLTEKAMDFIETLPEPFAIKYFEGEYFNIELYSLDYVPVIN